MCIIITKPKGYNFDYAELEESLKQSRKHNSHGGGFALKRKNAQEIRVSKGYMYTEILLEELDSLDIQSDDELIVHLRFSTAGIINATNCHPFVVSIDINEIINPEIVTKSAVMAHNGTFTNFQDKNSEYSDTVHFIKDFLALPNILDACYTFYDYEENSLNSMFGNNRIAVIFPDDREMMMIGSWNIPEKKNKTNFFYSNYYYCNPHNGYVKPHIHNVSHNQRKIGFDIISREDDLDYWYD
jgi:predicted glutamine amidotransferase